MKKSSVLSRPEKLISVKAEDIFNKPLTKKEKESLRRLDAMDDSEIDYSDIPPMTDEQIAGMTRRSVKKLIAIRIDQDILDWLKSLGSEGYSTRINEILRSVMAHRQQNNQARLASSRGQ